MNTALIVLKSAHNGHAEWSLTGRAPPPCAGAQASLIPPSPSSALHLLRTAGKQCVTWPETLHKLVWPCRQPCPGTRTQQLRELLLDGLNAPLQCAGMLLHAQDRLMSRLCICAHAHDASEWCWHWKVMFHQSVPACPWRLRAATWRAPASPGLPSASRRSPACKPCSNITHQHRVRHG